MIKNTIWAVPTIHDTTKATSVKSSLRTKLNKQYEDVPQKIIGAIKRSHIDNW